MTSGRSESYRSMGNMQTTEFEDKSYYLIGNAVYNSNDYDFVMGRMGYTPDKVAAYKHAKKVTVEPFFVDLLRKGYTQWNTLIKRDRTIVRNEEQITLILYYHNTSPWSWHFQNADTMMVSSLVNSAEKAIAYANKKLTEQYLNISWLEMANKKSQDTWPGISSWYNNQYPTGLSTTP